MSGERRKRPGKENQKCRKDDNEDTGLNKI